MTDKKISELTSITGANVSDANDVLPIVDTSVATTKKITRAELFKSVNSVDIDGGTIDGTVIGGGSAAAGSFTTLTATGNVVLGNAATDTVTITADVASNIIPSADNTYDLGASGSEWKNLYIDGTANIDSLVAGTADINGGTINGTVIGGSTPAAISGTTGTFSGDVSIADKIVHRGDTNTALRFPAADTVTVETAGSERMRIDSSGNVLCGSDGGGDIGSSTKRFKDLYLSGGIVFGATGGSVTSKTLEDYEEGTWTVEAYDAPTGGNVSSSTNTGYYTKVGRTIMASVALNNIDTTGMTAGNVLYLTLPYASINQAVGSVRLYANVDDATVSLVVFAAVSATRVSINESRDDTNIGNVTIGDLTSGVSDVAFTITYQV